MIDQPSVSQPHPSEDLLIRFSLGNLNQLDQDRVENHLQTCQACLTRLRESSGDDELVSCVRQAHQVDCTQPRGNQSKNSGTDSDCGPSLSESKRYDLKEKIAVGGMGEIWSAHDKLLDRKIALKIVRADIAASTSVCQRFERECRTVAQLQHPGIPPVHDLARLSDGRPFLAMKLIDGKTLRECIDGNADESRRWLMEVFLTVCQTLGYAHNENWVHRDLKPENVMVGEFGETQVMDWGIAENSDRAFNTITDKFVGTPAYMSPEQALGLDCSSRSDVYSLGLMLCEILVSDQASDEPKPIEKIRRVIGAGADRIRELLTESGADPALIDLAISCIEFEPTRRPANAEVLAETLINHQQEVQAKLRRTELERTRQMVRERERRRRKTLYASFAALATTLIAITGLAFFHVHQRRAQTSLIIEQLLGKAANLQEQHRNADDLARPQLSEAIAAAENASDLADQPGLESSRRKCNTLLASLNKDLDRLQHEEQLLLELRKALVYVSERTVDDHFEQRKRSRLNRIADGHFQTLLFLNKPSGSLLSRDPDSDRDDHNELRFSSSRGQGYLPGPGLQLPRRRGRAMPPHSVRAEINDFERTFAFFENVFPFAKRQRDNYETAFSRFGIQPIDSIEQTHVRVQSLRKHVRDQAISGLRLWFLYASDIGDPDRFWLAQVLDVIDRSSQPSKEVLEWRRQVRNAIAQRTPERLFELCDKGSESLDQQPEELVWGLGCFAEHFSDSPNDRFLRLAQVHHPQSYLINRTLALVNRSGGNAHQSVPYLMAALAIVPDQQLYLAYARKHVVQERRQEFNALKKASFKACDYDPKLLFEWADAMSMTRPREFEKALDVFRDAIDTYWMSIDRGFPEPEFAYARIGQLYFEAREYQLALDHLQLAAQCPDVDELCRSELDSAITRVTAEIKDTREPTEIIASRSSLKTDLQSTEESRKD